jgi:hypothetical protein
MHRDRPSSKARGKKRQASPTPSFSSVEGDSTLDQSRLVKKSRLTSPARIKQAVLAKVANKSKLGSSSKGLAGFAALVNNSNLAAARKETNRGLRPGSSSTQSRGGPGTSAKSKTGKTVRLSVLFTHQNLLLFSPLGRCVCHRYNRFSPNRCQGSKSYISLFIICTPSLTL